MNNGDTTATHQQKGQHCGTAKGSHGAHKPALVQPHLFLRVLCMSPKQFTGMIVGWAVLGLSQRPTLEDFAAHKSALRNWKRLAETAGIVALTFAAALLRWSHIFRSLRRDELTTAWVIRDSLADILPRSMLNNLSPFYYGLTWISTSLAGYDEVGMRLPSFLASVAVVPAIYLTARVVSGSRSAAFLSALIATVDPTFLSHATEARPYALIQLFSLINIYLVVRYFDTRSPGLALMATANAVLLFYLHYTCALFAGIDFLIIVLGWMRGPGPSRKEVKILASSLILFAVATLPAISQILYLLSVRKTLGSFIVPNTLEDSIFRFNVKYYCFVIFTLAAVLSFACGDRVAPRKNAEQTFARLVMLLLWFFLPCLAAWAFGRVRLIQVDLDRYVIGSSIACALLPAVGVSLICVGRRARVITFVILVMSILWQVRGLRHDLFLTDRQAVHFPPQWREVIARVNDSAPPGLPILVQSGLVEAEFLSSRDGRLLREYLLCTVNSIYTLKPELLNRAWAIDRIEDLENLPLPNGFLFLGYDTHLKSLKGKVSEIAGHRGMGYKWRPLMKSDSPKPGVTAIIVEFAPKHSSWRRESN